MSAANTMQLLRGTDGTGGTVTFAKLVDAYTNNPVSITLNASSYPSMGASLPGNETTYTPQIAVKPNVQSPSTIDRIHLAYHDLESSGSANVDVNTRTLDARGTKWVIGPETKVPGNVPIPPSCPTDHSDQYLAAIDVDGSGRVHVIYYDDRTECQSDTVTTTARYGFTYAYSCDSGQSFSNIHKDKPTGQAAYVDFALEDASANAWSLHEYIGIAFLWTDSAATIIASVTGTDDTDSDNLNDSCVYVAYWTF